MTKFLKFLFILFSLIATFKPAVSGSIYCDLRENVGLTYFISDNEARPPKALFGNYNVAYVQASVIKSGTILQAQKIGGAIPNGLFRVPVNGEAIGMFRFPALRNDIEVKISFTDDGTHYFLEMSFEFDDQQHQAIWKCV